MWYEWYLIVVVVVKELCRSLIVAWSSIWRLSCEDLLLTRHLSDKCIIMYDLDLLLSDLGYTTTNHPNDGHQDDEDIIRTYIDLYDMVYKVKVI